LVFPLFPLFKSISLERVSIETLQKEGKEGNTRNLGKHSKSQIPYGIVD
jgi:hypothetical protein